jgi:hypothetical protein
MSLCSERFPVFGSAPRDLEISANPKDLTPGTYREQVTITVGVAGAFVDVVFTVGPSSGGSLAVDRSGLPFIAESGISELPSQTLSVISGKPIGFCVIEGQNCWVPPIPALTAFNVENGARP